MLNTTLNLSNPDLIKQQCLIKDGWHGANDDATIEVSNPFNGDVIGTVPSLTTADVNDAVTYSHEAQITWAAKTPQERAQLLQKWADLIDANKEDLAIIMTAEQGKPLAESRGEIGYANSFIRWFAEEGKRVYGDVIPATNSQLRYVVLNSPLAFVLPSRLGTFQRR